MVWVYIALAILVLFLSALHLLRFHFSIDVQTPALLRGSVGVSFLWFRREVSVDPVRAVWGNGEDDDDDDIDDDIDDDYDVNDQTVTAKASRPDSAKPDIESPDPDRRPYGDGQRGALRIPESWSVWLNRFLARLQKALTKWATDFGVWRILFRFTMKSTRRVIGLLHPALKSMHLGLEDVYDLGRIAAAWSVVRGTIPALACPVEFGFNEPFNFRARLAGGFTGLNAFVFGLMTLFSFPWIPLGARFLDCWRKPRLNRWQRRVLLP